jgi:stage VI sporulation protein D
MMVDNRSGLLRFNIAEKIRLADNAASIQALEEIELVPEVEVNIRGEHAVLKGYLLLTGSYAGADVEEDSSVKPSNQSCQLQHRIPVEITLPVSRISEENNILVEIDNFDVDMVDPRSIMVTGSLTLSGINTADTVKDPERIDEDEMVFIDTALDVREKVEENLYARLSQLEEVRDVNRPKREDVLTQGWNRIDEEAAVRTANNSTYDVVAPDERVQETPEEAAALNVVEEVTDEDRQEEENVNAPEADVEREEEEADELEAESEDREPEVEAKKEVKIAFGSKKREPVSEEPIHLASTFAHKTPPKPKLSEEEPQANEAEQGVPNTRESSGDTLDWARMLRKGEELPSSSYKLRIGLVQNDDTLETLGQRFGVNPKELALLNKLDVEGELIAGQTVYIPKTKSAPVKEEENRRRRGANG